MVRSDPLCTGTRQCVLACIGVSTEAGFARVLTQVPSRYCLGALQPSQASAASRHNLPPSGPASSVSKAGRAHAWLAANVVAWQLRGVMA